MDTDPGCPLTTGQLEVIWAAHELGDTNSKAIGGRLRRSWRTIDKHYEHIFERTGVHTRFGVDLPAQDKGWLLPPPPPADDGYS